MKGDNNLADKEDIQYQKERNKDRRHAERHDQFSEDDTVDRITIYR